MGIFTLCFLVMLIYCGPFIGQGQRYAGPCQPFSANQSLLCTEFETLVDANGVGKFCDKSQASCRVNTTFYGPHSRDDRFWGYCYCDEICKGIGDCCVDYDQWYSDPSSSREASYVQSCRRRPSHDNRTILGYVMVASCPSSWQNSSISLKCMSNNHFTDPSTALPVFDPTENVTYANIYCAICHEKTKDLYHWSLKIHKNLRVDVSVQDVALPNALWEALPGGDIIANKCIVTPEEAFKGPDTKNKRLCREYANSIGNEEEEENGNYKNPHCAMLSNENILVNSTVVCHRDGRLPSRLSSMIFIFSRKARFNLGFRDSAVRLEVSCANNEIYDPFKGRCLSVVSDVTHKKTSQQSVYVISHQKVYNNDSFIRINKTLILCSNFSRNYTKVVRKPGNDQNATKEQSLKLIVITYVGFSLSIISLIFLLVTYFLFGELRTYPGKAVIHLSCAMIVMQSVYFASDPDVVSSIACAVLGGLLHYSILAVFLWMGAIAHNTQKTFSKPNANPTNPLVIAQQKRWYIGYSAICWGLPIVAVGVCMALQLTDTGNVGYGSDVNKDGCQLSLPARIYAIAIPVSSLLLFNIVALIRTAFAIKQHGQGNAEAVTQRNLPIIVLKLTVVTGITWLLGFALAFYPTPYLEYPYVVINSFQGFLICVIFVFRKPVIKLFKQRFTKETHPAPTTCACKQPTSRNQQPANTAEERTSGAKQASNKAEEQTNEAEKTCARGAGQPVEESEKSLDAEEQVISGTSQENFGAEQA